MDGNIHVKEGALFHAALEASAIRHQYMLAILY